MPLDQNCRWQKAQILKTLVLGLTLLVTFVPAAYPDTVSIEAAKIAAANRLPLFYPGDWKYFTHFTLHNLAGEPKAYAIVFSKADTTPSALDEVETSMASARREIQSLSSSIDKIAKDTKTPGKQKNRQISELQSKISRVRSTLHGANSFATVTTAAQDYMPIVLTCHKGLPTPFVKKAEALELLNEAYPHTAWKIGRFLYLGPFDEAFEAISQASGDVVFEGHLPDDALVVDVRTESIKKVEDLDNIREQFEQGRSFTTADEERRARNKMLWRSFMKKVPGNKLEGELITKDAVPQGDADPVFSQKRQEKVKNRAPSEGVKTAVSVGVDAIKSEKGTEGRIRKQGASLEGTKEAVSVETGEDKAQKTTEVIRDTRKPELEGEKEAVEVGTAGTPMEKRAQVVKATQKAPVEGVKEVVESVLGEEKPRGKDRVNKTGNSDARESKE